MESTEKPQTDKYKEIKNDELWRQMYAYITSGLGQKISSVWFVMYMVMSFHWIMIPNIKPVKE